MEKLPGIGVFRRLSLSHLLYVGLLYKLDLYMYISLTYTEDQQIVKLQIVTEGKVGPTYGSNLYRIPTYNK